MVQEWKRGRTNQHRFTPADNKFFPRPFPAFLLGETGLTTVERCFYSKKREKEGGGTRRNDAHPRDSIEIRPSPLPPPGKQS